MYRRAILVAGLMILGTAYSYALEKDRSEIQTSQSRKTALDENELLDEIKNADWKIRNKATIKIEYLLHIKEFPMENHSLKAAIIQCARSEVIFYQDYLDRKIIAGKTRTYADNEFGLEYDKKGYLQYMQGMMGVLFLLGDLQAIPTLLSLHKRYAGDLIQREGYMLFGKDAIPILLKAATEGSEDQKQTAYDVIAAWISYSVNNDDINKLMPSEIDAILPVMIQGLETTSVQQKVNVNYGLLNITRLKKGNDIKIIIKNLVKHSLGNKNGTVRANAAKIIGELGDESDLSELERIKNDEYQEKWQAGLDPYIEPPRGYKRPAGYKVVYPVREAAEDAIKKIQSRVKREM